MTDRDPTPTAGRPLTPAHAQTIADTIAGRRREFPDEDLRVAVTVALLNAGARYAPVACVGGEWSGRLADARWAPRRMLPVCPASHVLLRGESGVTLGWVAAEEPW